jgi:hypothetical protein
MTTFIPLWHPHGRSMHSRSISLIIRKLTEFLSSIKFWEKYFYDHIYTFMTSSRPFNALTVNFANYPQLPGIQLLKLPHFWTMAVTTAIWQRWLFLSCYFLDFIRSCSIFRLSSVSEDARLDCSDSQGCRSASDPSFSKLWCLLNQSRRT